MVSVSNLMNREKVNLDTSSRRFEPRIETFQQQFSGIYRKRLQTLWPVLLERIERKWKPENATVSILSKIGDAFEGENIAIIGTVVLHQKGKPSILDEISKSLWDKEKPFPDNFWSEKDEIWIEDESGRILLDISCIDNKPVLATGMVLAFLGSISSNGSLVVETMLDPGLPEQQKIEAKEDLSQNDKYVAIISGLSVSDSEPVTKPMQMLVDFLGGALGGEQAGMLASSISCLVVAGNSIEVRDPEADFVSEKAEQYGLSNTNDNVISSTINHEKDSFKNLDSYFLQLSKLIPVLVMPGELDPVNIIMPQQKIPVEMLLPSSAQLNSFYPLTNPSWFSADKVNFLGSSGQNVDDIRKCTNHKSALQVSVSTLTGRHICPTCPDTLPCYPSLSHDPFLLNEAPHVYFVGNQESFDSISYINDDGRKVLIVLVPKFKKTAEVVLVRISDFETKLISFEL